MIQTFIKWRLPFQNKIFFTAPSHKFVVCIRKAYDHAYVDGVCFVNKIFLHVKIYAQDWEKMHEYFFIGCMGLYLCNMIRNLR